MFLMMFGALLVLGGILYMARTAIWWGSLSRPRSSGSVPDTLEPSRGGVRFLGLGANWPGILLMAIGAALCVVGCKFLTFGAGGVCSAGSEARSTGGAARLATATVIWRTFRGRRALGP